LFDSLNLELLAVSIEINKKQLIIATYYNPPNIQSSEMVFNLLSQQNKEFIILGDLNSKSTALGCAGSNPNGLILEKIICENDCVILNNNDHTYFSFRDFNGCSDKLDLLISSSTLYSKVANFTVLKEEDMTSDHVSIKIVLITSKRPRLIVKDSSSSDEKFNYNKANWEEFKRCLTINSPSEICDDVENLDNFVTKSLLDAVNSTIPRKLKNGNQTRSLPEYLLLLIKRRKDQRRKAIKNGDAESKREYNFLTNIVREEINELKNRDWGSFIKNKVQIL
jgi:hypothetical protein